jgi:hypothetical protein
VTGNRYSRSSTWRNPRVDPDRSRYRAMGLYERLLEERYEEEQARGRPLVHYYGLDSVALKMSQGSPCTASSTDPGRSIREPWNFKSGLPGS